MSSKPTNSEWPSGPGLTFTFRSELYRKEYPKGVFVFAGLPEDISADIKDAVPAIEAPWGMINCWVQLGDEQWKTILFPRKAVVGYDLAFKAQLRKRLKLEIGDTIHLMLFVPITDPLVPLPDAEIEFE